MFMLHPRCMAQKVGKAIQAHYKASSLTFAVQVSSLVCRFFPDWAVPAYDSAAVSAMLRLVLAKLSEHWWCASDFKALHPHSVHFHAFSARATELANEAHCCRSLHTRFVASLFRAELPHQNVLADWLKGS